uniref:Uncharacterized protein n=1 Tax=Oryza glumipatula TaxID=40148 RepID=A0A0D9YR51_9ORYZ
MFTNFSSQVHHLLCSAPAAVVAHVPPISSVLNRQWPKPSSSPKTKLGIMAWINEEALSKPSDQVKVQTYHEGSIKKIPAL